MKILFVAMQSSIHTFRWLSQLDRKDWDIHIFSVDEAPIRSDWDSVTIHSLLRQVEPPPPERVNQKGFWWPFSWQRPRVTYRLKLMEESGHLSPARRLAWAIKTIRPDVIHVLEMQHSGYLFLETMEISGKISVPVVYSSWGSDMYFFGRRAEHREKIRRFLSLCQYHIADCERDVHLAREHGFSGISLGVVPGVGGMDVDSLQAHRMPGPVSQRRVIAVKGYHDDDFFGRGLVALDALLRVAPLLKDYAIVVYLISEPTFHVAPFIKRVSGLDIKLLSKEGVPNKEILALFGKARISIALSVSDGTPNSMLESMVMGAFPIQSDTVSTGEWIENGKNGFLVQPEDPAACAEAIAEAVRNDELVNEAAKENLRQVKQRIDRPVIQSRVNAMYRAVLDETPPDDEWLTWPR